MRRLRKPHAAQGRSGSTSAAARGKRACSPRRRRELLLHRVPRQRPAQPVADVAQVADRRRAVADLRAGRSSPCATGRTRASSAGGWSPGRRASRPSRRAAPSGSSSGSLSILPAVTSIVPSVCPRTRSPASPAVDHHDAVGVDEPQPVSPFSGGIDLRPARGRPCPAPTGRCRSGARPCRPARRRRTPGSSATPGSGCGCPSGTGSSCSRARAPARARCPSRCPSGTSSAGRSHGLAGPPTPMRTVFTLPMPAVADVLDGLCGTGCRTRSAAGCRSGRRPVVLRHRVHDLPALGDVVGQRLLAVDVLLRLRPPARTGWRASGPAWRSRPRRCPCGRAARGSRCRRRSPCTRPSCPSPYCFSTIFLASSRRSATTSQTATTWTSLHAEEAAEVPAAHRADADEAERQSARSAASSSARRRGADWSGRGRAASRPRLGGTGGGRVSWRVSRGGCRARVADDTGVFNQQCGRNRWAGHWPS